MSGLVRILAIGGLDPSGRAGLLADVQTVGAMGAHPAAIASCLTAQGGRQFICEPVSPRLLRQQVAAVFATGPVHAIKLGVVPTRQAFEALFEAFVEVKVPVVVDPVTRTSAGERLSSVPPASYLRWAQHGAVLTPNLDELTWLGEVPLRLGLVVKSVAPGVDQVFAPGKAPVRLVGRPLPRNPRSHRGTGCRFASALAVGLARGQSLRQAAEGARRTVRKFLRAPILAHR